jgi:signal transduction histidine kinase
LLSPLESKIRSDEIENLGHQLRGDRSILTHLEREDIRSGSPALRRAAKTLKTRIGGEIVIVGAGPRILAATDIDAGDRFPEAAESLRTHHTVNAITGGGSSAIAHVAVPKTAAGVLVAIVAVHRLNDAGEAVGVVRRAFFGAAAISLAIALLLGLLLASRLVQRLRALRDTALRVAELGPVVEMRADDTRDEVGDLTRALVDMQNRLREQEHARRSFVSTASHELRTPLSSLRVMLDLLRDDLEGDVPDIADAREQVQRADQQAERLAGLAADLLDLSRLDAGLPSRTELIDLSELTRAVAAEFDVRTNDSGHTLIVDSSVPISALGDPGYVAQIIRIMLDNAFRHGPPAGTVHVRLEPSDARPSVLVSDDGATIAGHDHARIFERFERGAVTDDAPGFGLGLAIGRELATRMDATLTLEDDAQTTFRLTLAAPAPPP